jgi:hypothetical protein
MQSSCQNEKDCHGGTEKQRKRVGLKRIDVKIRIVAFDFGSTLAFRCLDIGFFIRHCFMCLFYIQNAY